MGIKVPDGCRWRVRLLPSRERSLEAFNSRAEERDRRIKAILGDSQNMDFGQAAGTFCEYLKAHLEPPCEVTGIEDFRWEEGYVLGHGCQKEYERLKKTKPSYRDRFELLRIEPGVYSEWMLFGGEALAAHVRRIGDHKEFDLGPAELKAVDGKSPSYQFLDDYCRWFVNSR